MNRNHRRLISSMAGADPAFLAGSFATDYPASSGQQGERGAFTVFRGRLLGHQHRRRTGLPADPYGSRIIQADGSAEDGPAMTSPPRRPPWSLVLPRHSTFLGRPEDDWQLDARVAGHGRRRLLDRAVEGLEAPGFKGTLTLDASMYVVTRAQLGPVVQTLCVVRTEPAQEDLAGLDALKSTVKPFYR